MIDYLKETFVWLIILSGNILLSHSADWNNNFAVVNVLCMSEECYDYVKFVKKRMNRKADPCNDFYEYVCGQTKNPLVQYYPAWSTTIEMSMKSFERIRQILEEESSAHDSPELREAKKLYKACMEMPYLDILTAIEINSYVKNSSYFPLLSYDSHGSLKRRPWTDIHKYYFSLTGDSGLYEIYTTSDIYANFEPLLFLTEVRSPFGRIWFKTKLKGVRKKMYAKYLKAILFSIYSYKLLQISSKILKERIDAVVAFRCEIEAIKALYPIITQPPHNYNVMTVGELENWYRTMSVEQPAATVRWVEVIRSLYGEGGSEKVSKDTRINVVNKAYHQLLAQLIDKTPNDVIVNHMHLYFMEKHLEHNTILQKVFMPIVLYDTTKATALVNYPGKRWHTCILSNTMDETIGKTYVKNRFPILKRQKIQEYARDIKEILKIQILTSNWLDPSAIDQFKNVVDDIKVVIGYPKYYYNEYLRYGYIPTVEPGNVEAHSCPNNNSLTLSAAIFQQPLHGLQLPKTVLYGSLGTFIGHELYHAFFTNASAQCYQFNIPPSKKHLYDERMKCFLKKYDKIPVRELKFMKPVPTNDGHRTLDENVPDAMGLKLAYEAFRKDGWKHRVCSILPLYRGITCEQLFFISFATMFCTDIEPDVLFDEVLTGKHSTPRIRVNEAVSNMKEFGKVFNCPKKAPMNLDKRCDIWN